MYTEIDYKYFQPQYADGSMPGNLFSFQAFRSEQTAIDWMEKHLDLEDAQNIEIREYCNDDIEGVTIIDSDENPLVKIEEIPDFQIETMLEEKVIRNAGGIENLLHTRKENETRDQYLDRVSEDDHEAVGQAIADVEEDGEYDFSTYGGNVDTEWYDEARELAEGTVMGWMLGESEDDDDDEED